MHTEIVWADTSTHRRGLIGSDSKKHRERWCAVTLVCMQRVIVCVEADTFNNSLYSLHGCAELLRRPALKQAEQPSVVYVVSEEARPKRCWSWKLSFKGWLRPKLKSILRPYPKDPKREVLGPQNISCVSHCLHWCSFFLYKRPNNNNNNIGT